MLNKTADILRENLLKAEIECEVCFRLKDPYSILKKLKRKSVAVDQLTDLIAFRIIVDNKEECYKALDIVHDLYSVLSESKDFIRDPKPNGYQSIHTIISLSSSRRAEVQIRTRAMHKFAELGRAAHLEYKRAQDQKLKEFFDLEEFVLEKVCEIQKNFTWTEQELILYEQEIEKIWSKWRAAGREESFFNTLVEKRVLVEESS